MAATGTRHTARARTSGRLSSVQGTPVPPTPDEIRPRSQWGFVALGLAVVLAAGVGFWAMYRSAGERVPVLVVARDVDRFDALEQDDLRVALVATDQGVGTLPESDLYAVIGRVARVGLTEGTVLSPSQLLSPEEPMVGDDEAVVGARLGPGAAPADELPKGSNVLVVIRSPDGGGSSGSDVREVAGWIAALGEPNPNTGMREASLVVPRASAAEVAAAAAEERIAVVGLEG